MLHVCSRCSVTKSRADSMLWPDCMHHNCPRPQVPTDSRSEVTAPCATKGESTWSDHQDIN